MWLRPGSSLISLLTHSVRAFMLLVAHDGACHMSSFAPSELLSCSFCGKSQYEVRSLIEGGCSSRGTSRCVFICDECVTLCAQINADTVGNAKEMWPGE